MNYLTGKGNKQSDVFISYLKLKCLFDTAWPLLYSLQWRHNEHDDVSNHQLHDCLLNHLFRHRSKKTSKLRVTGLCEGNSPVTGEFPTQRDSNAEKVSINIVLVAISWFIRWNKPASSTSYVCISSFFQDKSNSYYAHPLSSLSL